MEKKHRCKLCFRNFANGRALGGHMRSHMMKLYAGEEEEEKAGEIEHDFQSSYSRPSSSSSSSSEEEEEYEGEDEEEEEERERGYVLRENPKKSAIMADHDFSSVVVQDGESETESCRRRSKRVRSDFDVFEVRKAKQLLENEQASSPLSSVSDATPEEHVARCLIMLSRDTWHKVEKKMKNKFRGKYRCEECNKLFRSYQALGGHRASHKKIKAAPPPRTPSGKKIHQCPFCDRIFSSGQALGGHKRSHFIGAAAIERNSSAISQVLSIDLNLPAPLDDDEGSQIAISAVSDAEFVCNVKQ
ncbi:zinc finger protein ZAT4-like [Salvia miltiorrhiza]|uniref:zinc finger protein ZAT4-like n=1 Tax=Salvia miltiorrhiza TaxID=226208 RepID=UPI0025AD6962|nr:zinc finger protein ZAT4-like [Salvia miltiorrhiza]